MTEGISMIKRKWNHETDHFMEAIDISEEEWAKETGRFIERMEEIKKEHPNYGRSIVIQVLAEEFDPVIALAMYEDIVQHNIQREMFGEMMAGLRAHD